MAELVSVLWNSNTLGIIAFLLGPPKEYFVWKAGPS